MKRIGLTAILLGVALLIAGCTSNETASPDDTAPADVAPADAAPADVETDALPAEPVAVEQPVSPPSVEAAVADTPAEPEAVEQPADDSGAATGGAKIADAVGKALLKGILNQSGTEDPGEAPPFNQ